MSELTYYQILGISRGATTSEIKARYRVLAKRYHPDNNGNTQIMARVNDAYEVLCDPKQRFKYDQKLHKPALRQTVNKARPTSSRQYDFQEVFEPKSKRKFISPWRLITLGSAVGILTLVVIALSLGKPNTQQLAATNASHTTQSTISGGTNASSNSSNLSNQVAKEQNLASQYSSQAQQDQAAANQDLANANSAAQQQAANEAKDQQLLQQDEAQEQQLQQEYQLEEQEAQQAVSTINNPACSSYESQMSSLNSQLSSISLPSFNNPYGSTAGATAEAYAAWSQENGPRLAALNTEMQDLSEEYPSCG